jgi:YD repeat-containing protein
MRVDLIATLRQVLQRCGEAIAPLRASVMTRLSAAGADASAVIARVCAMRAPRLKSLVELSLLASSRRRKIIQALGFAACAAAVFLAADAPRMASADISPNYQLPRFRFVYGPEVTPGAAQAYFGGIPDTFNYTWGTSNRPPEITELADALNNDPFWIHKYVQETTNYVPTYGLSKGAMGVIIDRSGNAFDQAAFLAEMLSEARIERPWMIGAVRIKVGYVTLTPTQVTEWVGVSGDEQIRELFRSGGVPIEPSGGNYRIGHAWVEVVLTYTTGNPQTYILDPALKSVTRTAPVSAIWASIGTPPNPLPPAPPNPQLPTDPLTRAWNTLLDGHADAAATQISSPTYREKSPTEILGEEVIVGTNFWLRRSGETAGCPAGGAYSATDCLLRSATRNELFSFTDSGSGTARLPDEYRTRVRVCFAHATGTALAQPQACSAATKIDVTLFADEIYGRRLGLEPNMTFAGTAWSPQLKLDGATLATLNVSTPLALGSLHNYSSGRTGALRLEINHPYPGVDPAPSSATGSLGDAAHDFAIDAITSVAIVLGFGDTSPGLMMKLGERPNLFDPVIPGAIAITSGQNTKTTMGTRWLAQLTRMARFHESVNQARTIQHHWAGAVFSRWGDIAPNQVKLEAVRISVGGSASTIMLDNSSGSARTANRQAAEMTFAAAGNTLEGSVGEQSFDTPYSSSVARAWFPADPFFEEFFAEPDCSVATPDFYMVTLQDMAPRQVCGTRSGAGGWNTITKTIGAEYAQANYRVVTSNITSHGPYPAAAIFSNQVSQRGEAYVAYKQDANSSDIAFVLTDMDGTNGVTLKGGGGGASDQRPTLLESQRILQDGFRDRSVYNGIDLRTGNFTYSAAPDMSIGEGGFPYQLSVQRQFKADNTHCVNCPYGWTHNWDIEVMVFSDGLEGMGARTYQQMHTTLAAMRSAYLIYKDTARSEIQRQVDAARVMVWWRQKFILNVMAYRQGHAQRLYARIDRNRFVGPPGHEKEFVFDEDDAEYNAPEGGLDENYRRNWVFDAAKFTRHTASGEIQRFKREAALARPFFDTPGFNGSGSNRVRVSRYRIFSWRFPLNNHSFGDGAPLEISFLYWKDQPEGSELFDNALKRVSVSTTGDGAPGRCLWFEKDFGLQVFDTCDGSGGRRTALAQDALSQSATLRSFTSPAGYRERYEYESVPAGSRPSPFRRLVRVKPARTGSAPASEDFYSLSLVYNRLGQVREVHDAMSAVNCPDCAPDAQRPPVTIFSGGRTFARSYQPGVMDVQLAFDHYDRLVIQKELVDASNPDWAQWRWRVSYTKYDGRGRVIERIAPDGQRIQFDYNERDLPVQARRYPRPGSLEDQQGKVLIVDAVYHPNWDVITQLTDAGSRQSTGIVRNTTIYNYSPQTEWLKLNSVVLPSAFDGETGQTVTSTWSFSYDNWRRLTTQTDPRGNDATFTYPDLNFLNDFSRLTSVSAERGATWGGGVVTTTFQRNTWGLVTQTDQPGPRFANATYDDDGRTLTVSGPLNTSARRELDPFGRTRWTHARVTVSGVQQEQSVNTEFSRTGQATFGGRATKNGAPPQAYSLNSYDQADRVRIATDAEGRQVRFTYDMAGRIVREERQNANYMFETWKTVEYEANSNNISKVTDGEGMQPHMNLTGSGG